jgi:acetyl-CoA carboxylase biotin carboxyl carrier protein
MAKKKPQKTGGARAAAAYSTFTDTRRVQDLIALMTEHGLSEIELAEGASRIVLRRAVAAVQAAPVAVPVVHAAAVMAPVPAAAPAPAAAAEVAEEEELVPIKSIMVGTYYAAPSPDAAPYVAVGSHVDEKTIVCIIEAMKVFNPIAAEMTGTIVRILVTNGQTVEFGQPLFLVKAD